MFFIEILFGPFLIFLGTAQFRKVLNSRPFIRATKGNSKHFYVSFKAAKSVFWFFDVFTPLLK